MYRSDERKEGDRLPGSEGREAGQAPSSPLRSSRNRWNGALVGRRCPDGSLAGHEHERKTGGYRLDTPASGISHRFKHHRNRQEEEIRSKYKDAQRIKFAELMEV